MCDWCNASLNSVSQSIIYEYNVAMVQKPRDITMIKQDRI